MMTTTEKRRRRIRIRLFSIIYRCIIIIVYREIYDENTTTQHGRLWSIRRHLCHKPTSISSTTTRSSNEKNDGPSLTSSLLVHTCRLAYSLQQKQGIILTPTYTTVVCTSPVADTKRPMPCYFACLDIPY